MTAFADTLAAAPPGATPVTGAAFGHRLAPPGDPLEGASFDAIYTAKIEPELVKREGERKGALKTFLLALAAGLMLVFLEYKLFASSTNGGSHNPGPTLIIFTMIAAGVLGYLPLAGVAKRAKVSVLEALCGPLGISYRADGPDPSSIPTYRSLHLLPGYSDKAFQDFFAGRRGRVDFGLCEATLHEGSGKSRHLVFQGQLFRLVTPRRLGSTTVVLRNSGWLNRFECPSGLRAVGLEDPNFTKAFAVFGGDQVEAREILTPTFMQRLNDLEAAYAGHHIRCAFTETELLIALEAPNRFEIGNMFTSLVQRARVETIARNLDEVFKLIDEFQDC
ncbi:MAG TPA: DUF3137 domain-containing protein [Caulobacteraceae bacterium]|nr:DUF3137 domain-containing protein [Caulobacteraceae bacterium]